MTSHQLLHEIGVFILGAASCAMVELYVPMPPPFKQIAVVAIGLGTLVLMAKIAGFL